jgi:flagellar hook assembly protein FlgD/flagellar motor protein MotB
MNRRLFQAFLLTACVFSVYAQFPPALVKGADSAEDLYAPRFLGSGAFSTSQGGAHAGAVNPAAGGDAQRIVFDLGYTAIPAFGGEPGLGHSLNLGALFPTKYAVLGGSVNFFNSPYADFLPVYKNILTGNLNASKEVYPGLNVGLGFNFGVGDDWAASGDLGFRYNLGKLANLENFTLGIVLKSMGKSTVPSAFTPLFGVSADIIHLRSAAGNTADPLRLSGALDLGLPSVSNLDGKIGFSLVMAELITLSVSWGFNGYENLWGPEDERRGATLPSIGLGVNMALKSGGRGFIGGRLPSDGDLSLNTGVKPMYNGITAVGLGLTWNVGTTDKTPPVVTVDYPAAQYISPNNDGLSDYLEFPLSITDQRYVNEWRFEIRDSSGLARSYRNKERRRETQSFKGFFVELARVKAAVDIPDSLRWDGILDSGEIAPDGLYTFSITAVDDNGNSVTTPSYEVIVDNTPPSVEINELAETSRIFSPDGDGNKDLLVIGQAGSLEDRWDAVIYDMAGQPVKTFDLSNTEPAPLTWDGTGDTGAIVTDGVYEYRIASTDRAQNTGRASLGNIIVSTIQPSVALTIADAFFSPNGDGVKDRLIMNAAVPVKEGIVGWQITVKDGQGADVRTVSGEGKAPPGQYNYDGRNDAGLVLPEGNYQARLDVRYRNGYVSQAVSPPFTLDITPPRALIAANYTAFSPNNDGNQDEITFTQSGSDELLWLGEFSQAGAVSSAPPVRTVRMNGVPLPGLTWDGHNDAGALARDGQYSYRLSSTDPAGNTGRSNAVTFTLSTADTPVFIITDLRAFSPNGDGNRDTINIIPQLQEKTGVSSYRVEILDAAGTAVRTFDGLNAPPASISWNGRNAGSAAAPDGTYTARIEIRYTAGNQPSAVSRPFTLDTVPPAAELSAPYTLFSPNGDSSKDKLPIAVTTAADDEWRAVLTNSRGDTIRSWDWRGSAPELVWDGADEAGNTVPDGAYRFALASSDEAGNSFHKTIDNIVVDARSPRVFLTSSGTGIAPKDGADQSIKLGTGLSLKEGIESWKLELKEDGTGAALKTFPERGQPPAQPPESIAWNGRDDSGNLKEGRYTPVLTVTYLKGDVVTAQAAPITVDVSGPLLSFRSEPEYFSPDNDGVDDELTMFLGAHDASPIAAWSLEIREPQMDDPSRPPQLFYHIEGRGTPAERALWDGHSSRRELVQSATDYPFVFRAADILGNESVLEGAIGVDVLVIRDGDRLKIQVPSIVFRANAADFKDLPQAQVDNNNRILRRIAQILNKFRDYRVQVEGHANPTSNPVPPAEAAGDQQLSEERARATVDFLVGFGVSRGRLSATGRGSTKPVSPFGERDNWWKNRRVEFILIK